MYPTLEANHLMFRSGALTVLTVPLTVLTGEGVLVRDSVTVVGCEAGASLNWNGVLQMQMLVK